MSASLQPLFRPLAVLAALALSWPASAQEGGAPRPEQDSSAAVPAPVDGQDAPVTTGGQGAPAVLASLEALAPGFSNWVLTGAYARVLARPGLSLRERELLAIAALALMGLSAPLAGHLRGALRNGSSVDETRDILSTSRALTTAASPDAIALIDRTLDRLSRHGNRP